MEGAPEFAPQAKGPFHKRKRADLQTVALNALLKTRVVNGGKFVYGDNGCLLDLTGNTAAAGGSVTRFIVEENGDLFYYDIPATYVGPI